MKKYNHNLNNPNNNFKMTESFGNYFINQRTPKSFTILQNSLLPCLSVENKTN